MGATGSRTSGWRALIALVALATLFVVIDRMGLPELEPTLRAADEASAQAPERSRHAIDDAPFATAHARDAGTVTLRASDAGTRSPIRTSIAPPPTTLIDDHSVRDAIAAIATLQDRLAARRAGLIASGLDEESADTLTTSFRAQESALRLTQLGVGDPTWSARIDEYAAQREALAREGHDDHAALDALRARTFSPAELDRARAWESLDAMLQDAP